MRDCQALGLSEVSNSKETTTVEDTDTELDLAAISTIVLEGEVTQS